mgnify:CR=1 FL=1
MDSAVTPIASPDRAFRGEAAVAYPPGRARNQLGIGGHHRSRLEQFTDRSGGARPVLQLTRNVGGDPGQQFDSCRPISFGETNAGIGLGNWLRHS